MYVAWVQGEPMVITHSEVFFPESESELDVDLTKSLLHQWRRDGTRFVVQPGGSR